MLLRRLNVKSDPVRGSNIIFNRSEYQGVILDAELLWSDIIDKATTSIFVFRNLLGKI